MQDFGEPVVEVSAEPDFNEVSVDEELPPVKEKEAVQEEPIVEKEEKQPEAPVFDQKKYEEDLERERKDKATIAYNLRESQRQQRFLEEQLAKERSERMRATIKDEHEAELAKIAHLRDIDPDAYIRERERIMDARYRRESEHEREAQRTRMVAEDARAKMQSVEERLNKDFPDIRNKESELFREARATLESRYTPDEVAKIVTTAPQVMYDIVSEANARLRLKQYEAEKANTSREKRVASQGAVETQQKATNVVQLTREQKEFCKKNNFKEEDYARFVGKGRR
jgi:hypothetical protein